MGRELKRVPLDFDWPLNEVWKGYINPHYVACPVCRGDSETTARRALDHLTHLILIAGSDSLRQKLHPWLREAGVDQIPSGDMAELTGGLAGRCCELPVGHDALDRSHAVDAIIRAAGLDPKKWGVCPNCKGSGIEPSAEVAFDAWKEEEPPVGEGYQLWETTTEGSPCSPVFATLEGLCNWLGLHGSTFGSHNASSSEWKKMLCDGFVCHKEGTNVFI